MAQRLRDGGTSGGTYHRRASDSQALARVSANHPDAAPPPVTYFSGGEDIGEHDLVPFFRDFSRKLVLWAGPEVIEAFVAWKDHLAKGAPDAKSIFLTEDFLLAVRRDLRHTNKGIRRGLFARMFLKNSELFLLMPAKNPELKLEELAAMEKMLASTDKVGA